MALGVASIAHQLQVAAGGVTRFGLSHNDIRSLVLPIPLVDEQRGIVRFLTYSNARTNKAIRTKQEMIELLEEQKQAIINEVVTAASIPPCR